MTLRLIYRRSSVVGWMVMPFFLLFSVAYYFSFAADLNEYDGDSGLFQLALNLHDHLIYLASIELVGYDVFALAQVNDRGIAIIYNFLSAALPFLVEPDYSLIAFVFNIITLCACYWIYSAICDDLRLGTLGKLSFFVNLYFIYFTQLINKDLLTIMVLLLTVHLAMRRRIYLVLLLLPLFMLIRIQLIVFAIVFVFVFVGRRPMLKILLAYVATSLVAGYLSIFFPMIGVDSLEEGFSAMLVAFNHQYYYTGYLIFNPVRVLQYVVDAYLSFFFITETGGVDTAKILRLPQLVLLTAFLGPLYRMITQFTFWLRTPARPMMLAVVAFFIAWLLNPTINARYMMLITPVLVLFALYVGRATKRGFA